MVDVTELPMINDLLKQIQLLSPVLNQVANGVGQMGGGSQVPMNPNEFQAI